MAIINIRVDERLIHGQVANMWTSRLNITRIMVADDQIAESDIDKMTLKMAVPAGVKLSVLPFRTAAENIIAGKYDSQRVLLLIKSVPALMALHEYHLPMPEINVANVTQLQGGLPVTKSVSLSAVDITQLQQLAAHGTKIISQRVPNDDKLNVADILNNLI
ncbi:PTS system mannose/fructose/N-acetylgalactosamine-transporter subunit IIB [[Enterobacter] lignolyticus]|uniref:PTS system sorbose subfamily IIB component n=1 Tax=Enterobacter lignolyticus (strain SCF1) TaxID=701347 RepID=E3G1I3_ENTLS|nr:PTS sugar transporter subunit IIB [[Enterobacter] lignolyticus]ADO50268.1 PTS system sorbose subfamily IIB component [[Enterobacter] lignolyticus SCF1]